jgi:GxxExxY protein
MLGMTENNVKLMHGDLTHAIIGAGMDVHNALGPGWDEMDYHLAMLKAISERGLKAESHLRGDLMHRGRCVDRFELDIIVEDTVILELKHIRTNFAPMHFAQLINYLKFWGKDLGILINFGLEQLRFKRVPFTPNQSTISMTGAWDGLVDIEPVLTEQFLVACNSLISEHGLGYGETTSGKLMVAGCAEAGFDVQVPTVCLRYKDVMLGTRAIDGFVLDVRLLVKISALQERTTAADLARLMSYMRKLNLRNGVLVNFGRSELCLRGVISRKESNLH